MGMSLLSHISDPRPHYNLVWPWELKVMCQYTAIRPLNKSFHKGQTKPRGHELSHPGATQDPEVEHHIHLVFACAIQIRTLAERNHLQMAVSIPCFAIANKKKKEQWHDNNWCLSDREIHCRPIFNLPLCPLPLRAKETSLFKFHSHDRRITGCAMYPLDMSALTSPSLL